jgi:hypothetical protein
MRPPFAIHPQLRAFCHAVICLAILTICPPSSATTLVKCKIGKKTVYSDTECPDNAQHRTNGMSSFPASKTIRIKYPSKKSGGSVSSKK